MKKVLILLFAMLPMAAHATDWSQIKTLKCFFDSAANYDGKNVEVSSNPFGKAELIIDSININSNTARVVGNVGADNVLILNHEPMLGFVGISRTGNLVFSTIYEEQGAFSIVSSRHVLLLGKPIYSQNYGTCKVWG